MILIGLLLSLGNLSCFLLLCLQPLHDLLGLLVFVDHDVTHTEISYHNGSQTEHVVCIFVDNGFVISDGFVVTFKHEEDVSHVQLPCLVVSTELGTLSE